ncbi:hypothetical protein [Staphylococcus pasteuri]|uniref:hypothetical protein n=1 Tax=Staphylococcus pasteuri TaxID=45972 RepID=UPI000E6A10B9|nr:hypothetical protein [Staphylococcus pasteuri]MCT1925724.1 hypothetical protein [Staphylococcus pasteuri]QQT11283.1 hypothetical protein I6J09_00645 [Staphylococcus pasteuri]RIO47828.1 hypothetical protein BUZ64_11655 [Staphylococcus pasteuri]
MKVIQLDGDTSAKELRELFEELAEEIKKRRKKKVINQNQKINSILSSQVKRKWCYFLYRF